MENIVIPNSPGLYHALIETNSPMGPMDGFILLYGEAPILRMNAIKYCVQNGYVDVEKDISKTSISRIGPKVS